MGDPKVCSIPCANGVVLGEDCGCKLPSSSELRNDDFWARAEMAAQEIFSMIQPTLVADQKRKNVVQHVQGLIRYFTGCEVFTYGSVPLKTYLPNGDIDLTIFCCLDFEDSLVSEVYSILKGEEHNKAAQYKVKDVHCIDAEVKLVKCIVQDVVVDISFNQLGGLSTLCFLEQVDRLIGKDHLFKRSIILVKAWCYYESRILGAHHGLISTYALETLVLYILHKFHSSLMGPLAVLYKFLDYFGNFDWENYCISLKGPVCKSFLPNIVVAEPSEDGKDDVLLSEDFLRNCLKIFSISPAETNLRPFSLKHLNIIDPLKETNNLGRSVGRGNFYRIRSAFKYGAEQLGRIHLLPRERISGELRKFFANCLDRPGSNCWTDIQDTALASGVGASEQCSQLTCSETFYEQKNFVESTTGLRIPAVKLAHAPVYEPKKLLFKMGSSKVASELVHRLDGGVKDGCPSMKSGFSGCLPVYNHSTASFLPSSHMVQKYKDNGSEGWNSIEEQDANSDASHSEFLLDDRGKHLVVSNLAGSCNGYDNISPIDSYILNDVTSVSENMKKEIHDISRSSEASNLLELTGDYDIHFKNLQYGQLSQGYAMLLPPSPPLSPQLPCKNPLRTFYRAKTFPHNNSGQSDTNDIALGPRFYPANHLSLPLQTAFGEENKKPRGTGTFFLSPSCNLYNKRPYHGRGRNHAAEIHRPFWRHTRRYDITQREFSSSAECRDEFLQNECLIPSTVDSGSSDYHHSHYATTQQGLNSFAKCSHEHWPAEHPVLGHRSSGSSDYNHPSFTMWGSFDANAFIHSFKNLELESSCHKSATRPIEVNQLETGTLHRSGSPSSPGVQSTKKLSSDQESPRFRCKSALGSVGFHRLGWWCLCVLEVGRFQFGASRSCGTWT